MDFFLKGMYLASKCCDFTLQCRDFSILKRERWSLKSELSAILSVFITYLHGDGIHQIRHAYFAHLLLIFGDLN